MANTGLPGPHVGVEFVTGHVCVFFVHFEDFSAVSQTVRICKFSGERQRNTRPASLKKLTVGAPSAKFTKTSASLCRGPQSDFGMERGRISDFGGEKWLLDRSRGAGLAQTEAAEPASLFQAFCALFGPKERAVTKR